VTDPANSNNNNNARASDIFGRDVRVTDPANSNNNNNARASDIFGRDVRVTDPAIGRDVRFVSNNNNPANSNNASDIFGRDSSESPAIGRDRDSNSNADSHGAELAPRQVPSAVL
jgi:hypothetical protein